VAERIFSPLWLIAANRSLSMMRGWNAFREVKAKRPFDVVAAIILPNHLQCFYKFHSSVNRAARLIAHPTTKTARHLRVL